ncbi:G-type lectin S-receptor-like serine/threonine-protein kinase RLK1 [Telopea speciosissima]|uniref:G-type lectin S-receptor-like serine/threonine-protein kinase RLK1 n=1 Tax=Telopea speciosissima TaxID=54955 RepID=UPI001CC3FA78|nr:G-type lectin S-receptor-like serine/threonine-protein kinase RLK1 [Telopea speciosissima]
MCNCQLERRELLEEEPTGYNNLGGSNPNGEDQKDKAGLFSVVAAVLLDLEEATDGFKEELGRGAFSVVYKGVLGLDSKLVAVKKTTQALELVYEFMSNGSLASFLFGSPRPDWNQRTQIAFGIARGLMYLHEECSVQIIHCDIKPQNILLDDSYTTRISDFGLAKLLMTDQSRTNTAIRGTKGYVSPEWFRHMPITVKVDVYSFGVMLMEIICCRKSVELEMGGDDERAILTDWVYDCCREGRLDALVENDMEAMNDIGRLERLLKVAIWCIQEEPSLSETHYEEGCTDAGRNCSSFYAATPLSFHLSC